MEIRFEKRDVLKEKPDQKNLGFGKYMTDYMFVMDWTKEEGWKDATIVPHAPITLRPCLCNASLCAGDIRGDESNRTAEVRFSSSDPR